MENLKFQSFFSLHFFNNINIKVLFSKIVYFIIISEAFTAKLSG